MTQRYTVWRVHMEGYGDGYDDYVDQSVAQNACQEWEEVYGPGEAWITEEDVDPEYYHTLCL